MMTTMTEPKPPPGALDGPVLSWRISHGQHWVAVYDTFWEAVSAEGRDHDEYAHVGYEVPGPDGPRWLGTYDPEVRPIERYVEAWWDQQRERWAPPVDVAEVVVTTPPSHDRPGGEHIVASFTTQEEADTLAASLRAVLGEGRAWARSR